MVMGSDGDVDGFHDAQEKDLTPKPPSQPPPVRAKKTPTAPVRKEVIIDGKKYYSVNIKDESPCQ